MFDWLLWFTSMEHSKPLALVLFFGAFCGILLYVFTGKARAQRLESYKYMPFAESELPTATRTNIKASAVTSNPTESRKATNNHE